MQAKQAKKKSTTSTKTSSANNVKQPGPIKSPQFHVGVSLSTDKESPKEPRVSLYFSNRKELSEYEEFVVVEAEDDQGKIHKDMILTLSGFLFSSGFAKGEKIPFIHVIKDQPKTQYLFTLDDCEVTGVEFKMGKRWELDRDPKYTHTVRISFKDRKVDEEAERIYNMLLKKR